MKITTLEQVVKKHFGTTEDLHETGYILSDGTMVDLSGRHYSGGYVQRRGRFIPEAGQRDWMRGQRNVDHRELPDEIKDIYPRGDGSGGAAMFGFLADTGALRVMPGVGFSVVSMPTVEAVDAFVEGWNRSYSDEPTFIDILDVNGFRLDSIELQDPSVEEVMAFLEDHFDRG